MHLVQGISCPSGHAICSAPSLPSCFPSHLKVFPSVLEFWCKDVLLVLTNLLACLVIVEAHELRAWHLTTEIVGSKLHACFLNKTSLLWNCSYLPYGCWSCFWWFASPCRLVLWGAGDSLCPRMQLLLLCLYSSCGPCAPLMPSPWGECCGQQLVTFGFLLHASKEMQDYLLVTRDYNVPSCY